MDSIIQYLQEWLTTKPGESVFVTVLAGLLLALIFWLIKKLNNFFQGKGLIRRILCQRNFERRYLCSLEERESVLTINGLGGLLGDDIELSSIYVPLKLAPRMNDMTNAENLIACTPPNRDRFLSEDMLQSNDRIAILGQPGSGKSTLVSYLSLQYARNWRLGSRIKNRVLQLLDKYHFTTNRYLPPPYQKRFPILIRLRTIQHEEGLQLSEKFMSQLCAGVNTAETCPDGFFKKRLKTGRCIVFIDGLDEVAGRLRSKIRDQIYNLATDSDYKGNIFVLTSRSTSYQKVRSFKEHFTCGFTYDDILLFAKNWYQIRNSLRSFGLPLSPKIAERVELDAKNLVDAIHLNDNARRLAVNPLLLSMLAVVHTTDSLLPSRRSEFYDLCMPELLGNIAIKRGLSVQFQSAVKEKILKPVAFWMHRTQRKLFVDEAQLSRQIGELLPEIGYDNEVSNIDKFLRETANRGDVLVRVGHGEVGFVHRTFQEYLVAKHLAELKEGANLILKKLHDPWWEQVLLFYIGIINSQDAGYLIETILNRKEDPLRRNLFLAANCLGELLKVKPKIQTRVISELIFEFSSAQYEGLRQEARRSLLILGSGHWGNSLKHDLTRLLMSNQADVRYQTALVLVQLEKSSHSYKIPKKILETLVDMLCHKKLETRMEAHHALGGLDYKVNLTRDLQKLTVSPVTKIRGGAALAIGILGKADSGALEALGRLLHDDKPQVRWRAAAALGWLGKADKNAMKGLIKNLHHPNNYVRGISASALGELSRSSKEVIDSLINTLSDSATDVAGRAASALGWLGQAEHLVLEGLLRCLDADPRVQARAATALGELGKPDFRVTDKIIKHLQEDCDPEVRSRAAVALGWLGVGDRRVIEALLPNLGSKDKNVVESVTFSIAWLMKNNSQVLGFLVSFLESSDPKLRAYASSAMGRLGITDSKVIDDLLKKIGAEHTGDTHEVVRTHATSALRRLGQTNQKIVRGLVRVLTVDISDEVRWRAAFALGTLEVADQEVIDALVSRLQDVRESSEVRLRSADALARLGKVDKMVSSALVGLLNTAEKANDCESFNDNVCSHAAIALGWLGDDSASVVNALVDKITNSNSSLVRGACAQALGKLGRTETHIVYGLVALVSDHDSEVRARSATALADLAHSDSQVADQVANLLQDNSKIMRTNAVMAMYVLIRTLGQGLQQCIPEDKLIILKDLLNINTPVGHPIVGKESTVRDIAWWLLQEYNRVYPDNYRKAYG